MKTINIFLVIVIALGFLAFGPQSSATAAGTVIDPNPSGQDSGVCGDALETGFAIVYINSIPVGGCMGFVEKATSYPSAPGDLKFVSYPIHVFYNDANVAPSVTVCYPTKPKDLPGQIFQLFEDADGKFWVQLPTYQMDGMTCADNFGGGIFGYFGY